MKKWSALQWTALIRKMRHGVGCQNGVKRMYLTALPEDMWE